MKSKYKRKPEAYAPGDAIFYTSQLNAHEGNAITDTLNRKARHAACYPSSVRGIHNS